MNAFDAAYIAKFQQHADGSIERECCECGYTFKVPVGFYQGRGLALPRRCPHCRQRRRTLDHERKA